MRIFYRDWVTNAMEKLGMTEGQQIESRMVTRAVEKAQKKVEERNFEIRKNLLEYDEVMDTQRKEIYSVRQQVLEAVETKEKVFMMFVRVVDRARETYSEDGEGFQGWFLKTFGVELELEAAEAAVAKHGDPQDVLELLEKRYEEREEKVTSETMRRLEQYILLNAIDSKWKDHLHAMDALKAGIGLRGYGQVDPKTEYKKEGFELFQKLFGAIEDEVTSLILRIRLASEAAAEEGGGAGGDGAGSRPPGDDLSPRGMVRGGAGRPGARRRPGGGAVPASQAFDAMRRRQAVARALEAQRRPAEGSAQPAAGPSAETGTRTAARPSEGAAPAPRAPAEAPAEAVPKVGRNDPCPCGSGKKYKKCHGK